MADSSVDLVCVDTVQITRKFHYFASRFLFFRVWGWNVFSPYEGITFITFERLFTHFISFVTHAIWARFVHSGR